MSAAEGGPRQSGGLPEVPDGAQPAGAQHETPDSHAETRAQPAPLPSGWDEDVDLAGGPATIPDASELDVPSELRQEIEAAMGRYPDSRSAALPALAAAQRLHGWCSPEAIAQVSCVMGVTPAYLSAVATFYDMLRTRPVGSRYVYVCTSVACHLRGAKLMHDAIQDAASEAGLEDVEIREFECLGACDMAPMASVNGRFVGPLEPEDAREIVAALREGREAGVLPGRGLEDEGFRLPWDDREPSATPPSQGGAG